MTLMMRRVLTHVVALGAGIAMVQGLTQTAGPVPAWVGFLCGTAVTLVSLAQLRVKVSVNGEEVTHHEDPPDE